MRIDVVAIAYNSGAGVERLVDSAASAAHQVHVWLFLHSQHPATEAACARAGARARITLFPIGVNRGVAQSWNEGVIRGYDAGADVVILANDDIAFGPGDIDRLAERASADRNAYIVTCAGLHTGYQQRLPSHGYACFAINPVALDTIGYFDQNFFPAYCEDQDYYRRARLAGLHEANCPDTSVVHEGSGSIQRDPALAAANALSHAKNQEYYRAKWGGDAGHERLQRPFGDPSASLRIGRSERHRPYGSHDRADLVPS